MRLWLYLGALALAACQPPAEPILAPPTPTPGALASLATPVPEAAKPTIALPPAPKLTDAGESLVLEFETGGFAGYNKRPEWPGGSSGVTVGVGYDCGYYVRTIILSDWNALKADDRMRLAENAGITGQRARAKIANLHDIIVRWELAVSVFDTVDVAREFSSAKRAIQDFEDLRPNAQAAWISLGFNRGWNFSGPNRVQMRAARDLVPSRDYEGIANQFRKMVIVWAGQDIYNGMKRRRFAEAKLMETP